MIHHPLVKVLQELSKLRDLIHNDQRTFDRLPPALYTAVKIQLDQFTAAVVDTAAELERDRRMLEERVERAENLLRKVSGVRFLDPPQ